MDQTIVKLIIKNAHIYLLLSVQSSVFLRYTEICIRKNYKKLYTLFILFFSQYTKCSDFTEIFKICLFLFVWKIGKVRLFLKKIGKFVFYRFQKILITFLFILIYFLQVIKSLPYKTYISPKLLKSVNFFLFVK